MVGEDSEVFENAARLHIRGALSHTFAIVNILADTSAWVVLALTKDTESKAHAWCVGAYQL